MRDVYARLYESPTARAVLSGILLGLSFPPSPVSSLAFVAFLPFLSVFDSEPSGKRFIRYAYVFLVAFHVVTVYWAGGFTHGNDPWMMTAGAALLIVHPLFVLPFISGAWWVRRNLGSTLGYAAFISFWLIFDFFHERGEFSFPWMAIGNSQAYDLYRIQIAEFASVQGIGLLVLLFNVLAFWVIKLVADGAWSQNRFRGSAVLSIMAALYVLPLVYGWIRVDELESDIGGRTLQVGVVQPNIDPWEKWGTGANSADVWGQIGVLDSLTKALPDGNDLVIWPETAIPAYLLLPNYKVYDDSIRSLVRREGVNLITGFPHAEYFTAATAPVTARKTLVDDRYVDTYNSALLVNKDGTHGPVYEKVVLVPFAERLPHADLLRLLIEPLKWGVGISSWGQGSDTTVFRIEDSAHDSVDFSAMICYESVYPPYVRSFVRKGAQFLVVITNNSWWGRTSGPYQHAAYASLRAVENRRWVVQCANGGISVVVHPSGRSFAATGLFERAAFSHVIERRTELTPYTEYGDVVGWANAMFGFGLFFYTLGYRFRRWRGHDRSEE